MPSPAPTLPTRSARTLIVNADDLGYTEGVNRAIVRCAREGVLTSATLMANGSAFDDAVRRVRECPALGVGIHLVLTELPPVCAPGKLGGLVTPGGTLPAGLGALFRRLRGGGGALDGVRREVDRQIVRVLESGLTPTHLDSHKHVHVLPAVLDVVLEAARSHGIRWVRNPFERCGALPLVPALDRGATSKYFRQKLASCAIAVLRGRFSRRLAEAGLRAPDAFVGIAMTGLWTEETAAAALARVPPGLTEWMVHPGDCDGDLLHKPTRLRRQREQERDVLLSVRLRHLLRSEQIALTPYEGAHP